MGLKSLAGALWISANQGKAPKRGLKPTEEECQKETPSRSKTQEKTFEGRLPKRRRRRRLPRIDTPGEDPAKDP